MPAGEHICQDAAESAHGSSIKWWGQRERTRGPVAPQRASNRVPAQTSGVSRRPRSPPWSWFQTCWPLAQQLGLPDAEPPAELPCRAAAPGPAAPTRAGPRAGWCTADPDQVNTRADTPGVTVCVWRMRRSHAAAHRGFNPRRAPSQIQGHDATRLMCNQRQPCRKAR